MRLLVSQAHVEISSEVRVPIFRNTSVQAFIAEDAIGTPIRVWDIPTLTPQAFNDGAHPVVHDANSLARFGALGTYLLEAVLDRFIQLGVLQPAFVKILKGATIPGFRQTLRDLTVSHGRLLCGVVLRTRTDRQHA
jgi:hypothetical protein